MVEELAPTALNTSCGLRHFRGPTCQRKGLAHLQLINKGDNLCAEASGSHGAEKEKF